MKKITIISGSTRTDSSNKKLAKVAASVTLEGVESTYVDLRDYPIPLYDGDMEANEGFPEYATKLYKLITESDALIFVTPEYNGSYSAVLKNAIDWVSRSRGEDTTYAAFRDKPALVMAASPGEYGGIRAITETKTLAKNIHMKPLEEHIALGHSYEAFNKDGSLKDEKTYEEIKNLLHKLVE